MKKIAIIPARSGSKGLPNKNVLYAYGKPLIAYSIEAALDSEEFERIIVTTDSQEYIDLLSHYPVDFVLREASLASDSASSFVVIQDVLQRYTQLDYHYFVLLQPTSPLRNAQHIIQANHLFEQHYHQFNYLVSVTKSHKPSHLIQPIEQDQSLKHFNLDYSNYARQKSLPEYEPNGAIFTAKPRDYLNQKHFFGDKSIAYIMDSNSSLDIDDRQDFEYFLFVLQQRNKAQLLLDSIKQRILLKAKNFQETGEISLIGHSILDYWQIDKIKQSSVNNLAIAGITAKQYLTQILDKGLIKTLGNTAILMFGTNDIAVENWLSNDIGEDISKIIQSLIKINPLIKIYFLEIPPVALIANRSNQDVQSLNHYLKEHLKDIIWISIYEKMSDQYGKLNPAYTDDGLHFNELGYLQLLQIIEEQLS